MYAVILSFAIVVPLFATPYMGLIARFTDGPAVGLCKTDNVVYVAAGGSIISVDVSEPVNPVYLSHFQCGDITDQPDVHDNILVTGVNVYRYYVYDVSDPANMRLLWWYAPLETQPFESRELEFLGHIRVRDSIVYLIGHHGYNFFRVEDLHTPSVPETLAEVSGLDYNPTAVAVSSEYAFGVGGNSIWVFHVSPPESTRLLFTHHIAEEFMTFFMPGVEVFNDTLVCVAHSKGVWGYTTRFLPDSLHLLWHFPDHSADDYAWDSWVEDSLVFMANQGWIRVGVINGDTVEELCAVPSMSCCYDLIAENGILYTTDRQGGLVIYTYENPDTLIMLSGLDFGDATIDVIKLGDSLLVSRGKDGVVFFVPDSDAVRLSTRYDFGNVHIGKMETTMVDDRLIVVFPAHERGFYIAEISDSLRIIANHTDILVNGASAALAESESLWIGQSYFFGVIPIGGKLQLFNISNPSAPSLIKEYPTPNVVQISRFEDRLYVLTLGELRVYQIRDTLVFLGSYGGMVDSWNSYRCTAMEIARFDFRIYAYVTHFGWAITGGFNGLYTFDVSNPADSILLVDADSIELIEWLYYNRGAVNLRRAGSFLCLYDNCAGWFIFSLTTPSAPETIGTAFWQHNGNNNGYGLWFDPPYIYSCTGDDGFYVLYWDTTLAEVEAGKMSPDKFELLAHPNPFNSSCIITVPSGADVEIYDVGGRLIWLSPIYGASRDIQRGDLSSRSIVWTPDKSVRSGIYFVRAKIGSQAIAKRVVLIK